MATSLFLLRFMFPQKKIGKCQTTSHIIFISSLLLVECCQATYTLVFLSFRVFLFLGNLYEQLGLNDKAILDSNNDFLVLIQICRYLFIYLSFVFLFWYYSLWVAMWFPHFGVCVLRGLICFQNGGICNQGP